MFSFHILTLIISTGLLALLFTIPTICKWAIYAGLKYSVLSVYVLNSIKYVFISIGALTILGLNRCTIGGNKRLA